LILQEHSMAQAAFPFDNSSTLPTATVAAAAACAVQCGGGQPPLCGAARGVPDHAGFELGWDHAQHQLTPPLAHLHADNPVRQGWQAGRRAFGSRTLKATPAVRQWLALRLDAWRDGQVFEGVQVTPHFLAQLMGGGVAAGAAEPLCPVSRQPLGQQPDEAVVQRLNPAAAYAGGNLVVLHRTVADARGTLACDALLDIAQRLGSGDVAELRGLGAAAWLRLAVLASFATPLPHGRAACLPLVVLPGNRCRVINPVQALQLMLTLQFTAAGYARRLLGLAALMPGHELRQAFQIFMHTLLSRRLAVGVHATPAELRRAIEDSWTDPLVQRRWQRLAMRLTAADCELLLQRAAQRGLVVGGGRWISTEAATDGWALPVSANLAARRGVVRSERAAAGQSESAAALWANPGKARSLASQKLAS